MAGSVSAMVRRRASLSRSAITDLRISVMSSSVPT